MGSGQVKVKIDELSSYYHLVLDHHLWVIFKYNYYIAAQISITEIRTFFQPPKEGAVAAKTVTYDFARLMDNAIEVKCSEFADAIIKQ